MVKYASGITAELEKRLIVDRAAREQFEAIAERMEAIGRHDLAKAYRRRAEFKAERIWETELELNRLYLKGYMTGKEYYQHMGRLYPAERTYWERKLGEHEKLKEEKQREVEHTLNTLQGYRVEVTEQAAEKLGELHREAATAGSRLLAEQVKPPLEKTAEVQTQQLTVLKTQAQAEVEQADALASQAETARYTGEQVARIGETWKSRFQREEEKEELTVERLRESAQATRRRALSTAEIAERWARSMPLLERLKRQRETLQAAEKLIERAETLEAAVQAAQETRELYSQTTTLLEQAFTEQVSFTAHQQHEKLAEVPIPEEPPSPWDVPGQIIYALKGFVKGVIGWLVGLGKHAQEVLTPWVEGLMSEYLARITGELKPASPGAKIAQPAGDMLKTLFERVKEETKARDETGLPEGGELAAAIRVLVPMLAARVTAEGGAAAVDAAHPARKLNIWELVAGITAALPATDIVSRLLSYPLEAAIYRPFAYQSNEANPTRVPTVDEAMRMYWRGSISPETFARVIGQHGFGGDFARGWVELSKTIPPLSDILRFTVREVYVPERRRELLAVPTPKEAYEWGAKWGMEPKIVDDYWAAHWELPAIGQLNDMLYRNLINMDTYRRYILYHDYDPTMVDNFMKIIYRPYTRVDIRRMWDVGVVDEKTVYTNYLWLGYDEEHARKMTLWTKIYTLYRDIRAAYKKGWYTIDAVKAKLLQVGIPPERVNEIVKTLIYADKGDRVEKERDLTKSEIVKGVKTGLITWDQGREMLMDLGYDADEAEFVLAVRLGVAAGSPETYAEFKRLTEGWKRAMGLPYKEVPERLVEVEREMKKLRERIEKLEEEARRGEAAALKGELAMLETEWRQLRRKLMS